MPLFSPRYDQLSTPEFNLIQFLKELNVPGVAGKYNGSEPFEVLAGKMIYNLAFPVGAPSYATLAQLNTEISNRETSEAALSADIALKADLTYVNTSLALKASVIYVDAGLALKANTADLGTAAYLDEGTANGQLPLAEDTVRPADFNLLEARVTSVEQAQAEGMIGFQTKALMDADLAHGANTLAVVTNDNIDADANNGTYIKVGASGAGSWLKSTNDVTGRVSRLEALTAQQELFLENLKGEYVSGITGAPATGSSASFHEGTIPEANYIPVDSVLDEIDFYIQAVNGAGYTIDLLVATRTGTTNEFTITHRVPVSIPATGALTLTTEDFGFLNITAGQWVGFYVPATNYARPAYISDATGATYWRSGTNVDPGTTATWVRETGRLNMQMRIRVKYFEDSAATAAARDQLTVRTYAMASFAGAYANTSPLNLSQIPYLPVMRRGSLDGLHIWNGSAGEATIFIARKSGTLFQPISTFFVVLKNGENVLRAGVDFAAVDVEPGYFVGYFSPTTHGALIRYSNTAGEERTYVSATGAPTATLNMAKALTANSQFAFSILEDVEEPTQNQKTLLWSETFGGTLPNWNRTGTWTAPSGGFLSPVGTGDFSQYAYLGNLFGCEQRTMRVEFTPQASTDQFCVGWRTASSPLGGEPQATLFRIDGTGSFLDLFVIGSTWASVPAVYAQTALSAAIVAGRRYRIDIIRDRRKNRAVLWDTVTGYSTAVEQDGNAASTTNNTTGEQCELPTFIAQTGQVEVNSIEIFSNQPVDPMAYFSGDSQTNGYGVTLAQRWTQIVKDSASGDSVISGRDGALAERSLEMVASEVCQLRPKQLVIFVGTNDQDARIATYKPTISSIRDWCLSAGVELFLCRVPPIPGKTYTLINAYLDALTGVTLIDFPRALTLNHDGTTFVAGNYQVDQVHPNATGNLLMSDRVTLDDAPIFN